MKKIKVVAENIEQIKAALAEAQGKSRGNLLTANEVIGFAEWAEGKLTSMLPKNLCAGAEYVFHEGGPYAKAYKYAQSSTFIRLIRRSSFWYIDDIDRVQVWPQQKRLDELQLTLEQKEEAIKHFAASITVVEKRSGPDWEVEKLRALVPEGDVLPANVRRI